MKPSRLIRRLNTKHPNHLRNCQVLLKKLKRSVIAHLQSLEIEFQWYFPEQEEEDAFVRNPFSTSLAIANSLGEAQDKFFWNHSSARDIVHKMPFLRFWWVVRESYPQRSELASEYCFLCHNISLRDWFFSFSLHQTEARNQRIVELDKRLALSNTQSRISKLALRLQSQPSHWQCLWNSFAVWN